MASSLNLSSIMIGTLQPTSIAQFYEKVFERPADWHDGDWYGWQVGAAQLTVGEHSEMGGQAKDPARVMFNLETDDVKGHFSRLKDLGAIVIADPYEMGGGWIATLADPDGNYFQLVTPMDMKNES